MTVIVCVDDAGGILFNRRRVSSDCTVIDDIMSLIGDSELWISNYSKKLFPDAARICVSDHYLDMAHQGDFVFLESTVPDDLLQNCEKVIVYHWNRAYPSDVKFPLEELYRLGKLDAVTEFKGNSHDRITREVYVL